MLRGNVGPDDILKLAVSNPNGVSPLIIQVKSRSDEQRITDWEGVKQIPVNGTGI